MCANLNGSHLHLLIDEPALSLESSRRLRPHDHLLATLARDSTIQALVYLRSIDPAFSTWHSSERSALTHVASPFCWRTSCPAGLMISTVLCLLRLPPHVLYFETTIPVRLLFPFLSLSCLVSLRVFHLASSSTAPGSQHAWDLPSRRIRDLCFPEDPLCSQ